MPTQPVDAVLRHVSAQAPAPREPRDAAADDVARPTPQRPRAADTAARPVDDATLRALGDLRAQLNQAVVDLQAAAERLGQLERLRAAGHSWSDIVVNEDPPLVVETVARVLDNLGEFGSRFRREQALALLLEDMSITRISQLFGVSRQRISALVRGHRAAGSAARRSP